MTPPADPDRAAADDRTGAAPPSAAPLGAALPSAALPSAARRAGFALVLALAMGTGTFPGFAFGVLGPDLIAEFALSRTELGLLTTVFFAVGGLGSVSAGRIVDRVGARRTMIGAFAVVGASLIAMAALGGLAPLVLAAAFAGVSLAAGNPSTNKSVAEHVPPGRRGLTMGVKQAGVQLGAVLAGVMVAPVAASQGWRTALALSAIVPAVGIGLALALVPADPPRPDDTPHGERGPLPVAVRRLAVYAFLMGAAVAAAGAYLPLFAVERLAMSTVEAGAVAAAVGFVGVVSRIAWGWASERLRSFRAPLMVMGAGGALAVAMIAVSPLVGPWLVWLGAVLLGATAITWNAVGMLAVVAGVAAADAGRASGVVLFGFYTGFVPSPIAFGALVDLTGSYGAAWGLVGAILVGAGWWASRST